MDGEVRLNGPVPRTVVGEGLVFQSGVHYASTLAVDRPMFWSPLCCGPSLFASDVILIHGHICTGNPKAPWAQALAITGGRIDAVGTDQDILNRKQAKTEVIDLRGRTVVPGFSDSHTHMWFGGLDFTVSISRRRIHCYSGR